MTPVGNIQNRLVVPTGPRGTEFYNSSPLKPTEKAPVVMNFTFYASSKNDAPTMSYIAPAVVAPTVYSKYWPNTNLSHFCGCRLHPSKNGPEIHGTEFFISGDKKNPDYGPTGPWWRTAPWYRMAPDFKIQAEGVEEYRECGGVTIFIDFHRFA